MSGPNGGGATGTVFTTRPELSGRFGAASATHWLGAATAMSVLERGGNAFDAAVAGGFALQVAEPHLVGPGGEVPILLRTGGDRRVSAICGQGPAPAAATPERFAGLGLSLVPGNGLLPATVPGAFDAWMLLLRDHGTWRVEDVLAPAIALAREGVPVLSRLAATIDAVAPFFREHWPTSAALWLDRGAVPRAGAALTNPVLAATYGRLADSAREAAGAAGGPAAAREAGIEAARAAWSRGFVAEAIDRFCRDTDVMDASGAPNRGLLTGADMAAWSATVEATVFADYHGHRVHKCGPWTQGPVLLQQLALLDGTDLPDLDPLGSRFVHLVVEAAKLAFADREAFYGDPDFVDVPLDTLLSAAYAAERRGLIGEEASLETRPGRPDGRTPFVPPRIAVETSPEIDAMGIGEPTVRLDGVFRGDTVHIDVVDRHGNAVAAMPSGGWLQSSPAIPGLGFCLGTRGQMVWLDPAAPAVLAPGKRPRSTLSPSLVETPEGGVLVFGSPGGDQQDQWALTYFLRLVHQRLGLQAANDLAMFQTEHLASSFWPRQPKPGQVTLEDRFSEATLRALEARGHRLRVVDGWSLGRLCACSRDAKSVLRAAASARGMQCYASVR